MNPQPVDDVPVPPDMATFLASSVHDMKNSVSLLISGLEKALAHADPATFPGFGDMVQMSYEAKRINNNLIQLLTLYKLGQRIYPFDPQSICLQDFLQVMGAQNAALFNSQGKQLEVRAEADLYWYFDEDLVAGVIGNALNNAMRYTRDCVRVSAAEVEGALELRIEDNGRGYPEAMLQESIDRARGVDFKGGSTGLGLYFSAVVAGMHRNRGRCGEIRLENGGDLGGGCVSLRLP